jgi:hypothetical protein
MQQRVTLPGRPVVEPDRQHSLSGHVLDTAMATTGPQVLVQVGDGLTDANVVGVQYGSAGHRVAQAVQDRHALGRPQNHVERRHGPLAVGAAQQLTGVRVAALEHGVEPRWRCFALQPQAAGADAVPPPWGLAVTREVRFVVGGQLPGVVRLPAHRELGDVGHHPAAPPTFSRREQSTLGALLSSENGLEMRVGRKQACERLLPGVKGYGYLLMHDRQLEQEVMGGSS